MRKEAGRGERGRSKERKGGAGRDGGGDWEGGRQKGFRAGPSGPSQLLQELRAPPHRALLLQQAQGKHLTNACWLLEIISLHIHRCMGELWLSFRKMRPNKKEEDKEKLLKLRKREHKKIEVFFTNVHELAKEGAHISPMTRFCLMGSCQHLPTGTCQAQTSQRSDCWGETTPRS